MVNNDVKKMLFTVVIFAFGNVWFIFLSVFGCMHMPGLINKESVESSSNKCKNYLLNIY